MIWALDTSFDVTRKETPFFLVHGWVPGTSSWPCFTKPRENIDRKEANLSRVKAQRQHEYAVAWARQLPIEAKEMRSRKQKELWQRLSEKFKSRFEVGKSVWTYVKQGLTKKLAHMWHGPFRIVEKTRNIALNSK